MLKKLLSILLAVTIVFGCFSVVASARSVGVGGGAESFNPVEFSQQDGVYIGTKVATFLSVKITDRNYKVKITSMSAQLVALEQGDNSHVTVSYDRGTIVEDEKTFTVTGEIEVNTNSAVRYTIGYDILDTDGNVVWKNLTGYAYGAVSGSPEKTGAIGTDPGMPGDLDNGARFTSLDKLNSCYVQVSSAALLYTLKTQHFFFTFTQRRSETAVIEGNAPATLRTYPVNWPSVQWYRQESEGTWLMWSTPESNYYNFTVDMNSNDVNWDDTSNTVVSTEMYYLDDWDRINAKTMADKVLGMNNTFSEGFYVQKGRYTEESWNNFITALDNAQQVMLAVPGPNYGFKIACQNGVKADDNLSIAFQNLMEAPCDWEKYKDPIPGEGGSCGDAGTMIYTCICGNTKTESTSTAACTPSDEWTVIVEATCVNPGQEAQLCVNCESVINVREISPLGHEYEKIVTSAGCYEEGYTTYSCIRGDHSYKDDFTPVRGHIAGGYEYHYPTAILDGIKILHCADCHIVMQRETIAKPEGNFVLTAQSNGNTFFMGVLDSDLNASFTIPKNSVVNTKGVTTSLSITDIPPFGIDDTVTFQNSNTSESGNEIKLDDYIVDFEGATLTGSVINKDNKNNVTNFDYKYHLSSDSTDNLYVIKAVADDAEKATVAFAALTDHVSSAKISESDRLPESEEERNKMTNYIEVPGSAYIQIGTDRVTFENSDETYKFSKAEDSQVSFSFVEAEAIDCQVEVHLPVGTTFAIGNHKITINDFLTVKLSGLEESEIINSFVSDLENAETTDEATQTFLMFFIEVIGASNTQPIDLDFVFDPAGYSVSGTVESFIPYEGSDDSEITSVLLCQGDEIIQVADVTGSGVQEFTFDSVPNGEYVVIVNKINHVDREYALTVENGEITGLEYKIHLYGDITGEGKIDVRDYSAVLRHVKKTKLLDGYEFACADVIDDGKLNVRDYSLILKHVKKTDSLW